MFSTVTARFASEERMLRSLAAQPVHINTGIPYPCDPKALAATQHVSGANRQVLVTPAQAVREVVARNCETSTTCPLNRHEIDTVDRLREGLDRAKRGGWGPDLVIKMFADLDLMFFEGRLLCNVRVLWRDSAENSFGHTLYLGKNQAEIVLNPRYMTERTRGEPTPFYQMFGTMLHEMCHAYFFVRCSKRHNDRMPKSGHGEEFYTILQAVHHCARVNLGILALGNEEDKLCRYFMDSMQVEAARESLSHYGGPATPVWPSAGPASPMGIGSFPGTGGPFGAPAGPMNVGTPQSMGRPYDVPI